MFYVYSRDSNFYQIINLIVVTFKNKNIFSMLGTKTLYFSHKFSQKCN